MTSRNAIGPRRRNPRDPGRVAQQILAADDYQDAPYGLRDLAAFCGADVPRRRQRPPAAPRPKKWQISAWHPLARLGKIVEAQDREEARRKLSVVLRQELSAKVPIGRVRGR